jgi:hypothetical protein
MQQAKKQCEHEARVDMRILRSLKATFPLTVLLEPACLRCHLDWLMIDAARSIVLGLKCGRSPLTLVLSAPVLQVILVFEGWVAVQNGKTARRSRLASDNAVAGGTVCELELPRRRCSCIGTAQEIPIAMFWRAFIRPLKTQRVLVPRRM